MDLVFHPLELVALMMAGAIAAFIALDGETNWLEGAQLLTVYGMLGSPSLCLSRGRKPRLSHQSAAPAGAGASSSIRYSPSTGEASGLLGSMR
jgi:hypothetical protein